MTPDQTRQRAIAEAAFAVFAQYGFQRSSMADIAKAAGMSRPALYQYFSGKEDIARTMVGIFYNDACDLITQALQQDGPVEDVLLAGFTAKTGPAFEVLMNSPHGAELLEMGSATASDLAAEGMARIQALFAQWLDRVEKAGQITLNETPQDMAITMLAALDGIKSGGRTPNYAEYRAHATRLARVFAKALTA